MEPPKGQREKITGDPEGLEAKERGTLFRGDRGKLYIRGERIKNLLNTREVQKKRKSPLSQALDDFF